MGHLISKSGHLRAHGGHLANDSNGTDCCCPGPSCGDCLTCPSSYMAVTSGYVGPDDCSGCINRTWTLTNSPGFCGYSDFFIGAFGSCPGFNTLTIGCVDNVPGGTGSTWNISLQFADGENVFGITGIPNVTGCFPTGTYTLTQSAVGLVCPAAPATMTVVIS